MEFPMNAKRMMVVTMLVGMSFILVPYSAQAWSKTINVAQVPDAEYNVYVHESYVYNYAVLLAIPGSEPQVIMRHSSLTEAVGMDRPGKYVNQFEQRIHGFKTAHAIVDREGKVRAYLMISTTLDYTVMPWKDRIVVWIWDWFDH